MTQDTPLSVWPGIVTPSESRTNTMVMAGTTSTAGAKLIYQVHLVTCFTEQSTKPLPLDRLLEFSMLPLLPVSNADHCFFTWTEVLLEPCQHTSFSDLTSAIASKLKFPEQVPVVKNNNQLAYTMACKGVMLLNLPGVLIVLPTMSLRMSKILQLTPSVLIWWWKVYLCSSLSRWKHFISVLKKKFHSFAWFFFKLHSLMKSALFPWSVVRSRCTRDVVSRRKFLGIILLRRGKTL